MQTLTLKKIFSSGLLLAVALTLSGCGGSSGGGTTATNISSSSQDAGSSGSGSDSSPTQTNTPPRIGGKPASTATVGNWYSFRPWASDADGDKLRYSIRNKPSWASFNANSGHLNGTPSQAGTHNNIIIRVSDGKSTVRLPAFGITVKSPPVVNTRPTTPVIDSIIEGDGTITINYSHPGPYDSAQFFNNGLPIGTGAWDGNSDRTKVISGLTNGETYNISMKVYLWSPDRQSAFSNVVSATPSAPGVSGAGSQIGSFSLSWTAPATRADGTPLSLADIDGYRIYYGKNRGKYTNQVNITNGAATSKTVKNLSVGTYYLVMTTYDQDGRESAYSPEISKQAN